MTDWNASAAKISSLLRIYQSDKAKKGYEGPSAPLLQSLADNFLKNQNVVTGFAKRDGVTVAAALIFCHGTTATYQVGWSTDEGKEAAAQNLLLWQATGILKTRGIEYFDLGGVNDESAQGVKKFKEGMGGALVALAGHYV